MTIYMLNKGYLIFVFMLFLEINLRRNFLDFDHSVFKKINTEWTNSFLDAAMPLLRNAMTWIPLYLFLLVFVLINYRKNSFWWFILFISTIALTDMVGTYIIKHGFERVRPCNNPDLFSHIRLLARCPVGFGFTSNHAANHFGMATFFWISFRHLLNKWIWLIFLWAAAIAYAQVYVGVHYPLDILGGIPLGMAAGYIMGSLFNKQFGFIIFDNQLVS